MIIQEPLDIALFPVFFSTLQARSNHAGMRKAA
jgi:hypothetical protein